MFISTWSEQNRSINCKTRYTCKALIINTRHSLGKQLVRNYENSLKSLFSYINRGTQRGDGISPLLVQENPFVLGINDVPKAEGLSEYFSKVFPADDWARPTITRDNGSLSTDLVVVEKGTVLRSLRHLEPYESSSSGNVYPKIMKAVEGVISEP